MDEVLEKFGTVLAGQQPNQTNYDGLYKNWGKTGNQEQRRKDLLEIQKTDRHAKLDRFRGILEIVNSVEEEVKTFGTHKRVYYRPNIYVAGFNKASPTYSNVLMLSEWLIDKPEDFHENWYVTPCPKATRALVVASQGTTKCYSKFGQFLLECVTALPGGSHCSSIRRNQCCVLDCFFLEKTKTMYVLDLLAWNNQPMSDGETEFRYYWLQTEFKEMPELNTISKRNKLKFTVLPKVDCSRQSLNEFMMNSQHFENYTPGLDGFLFYHKRAHYTAGETPLVGWLFPFMVSEVLGDDVTVNEIYMLGKPVNYTNQHNFIEKFEAKYAKLKGNKARKSSKDTMDIDGKPENEVADTKNLTGTKKNTMETEADSVDSTDLMESENMPSGN